MVEPLTAKQCQILEIARKYPRLSTRGLRCSDTETTNLVQHGYLERAGVQSGVIFYAITDAGRAVLDSLTAKNEAK